MDCCYSLLCQVQTERLYSTVSAESLVWVNGKGDFLMAAGWNHFPQFHSQPMSCLFLCYAN